MSYLRLWTLSNCRRALLRLSDRSWNPIASYHTDNGVYGYMPRRLEKTFSVDQSVVQNRIENSNLYRWVTAYREYGHRKALVDPLELAQPRELEELDPSHYGLSSQETQQFNLHGIINTDQGQASVSEIKQMLESIYCSSVSAEFHYLASTEEREWFAQRYEQMQTDTLSKEKKVALAKLMLKCEAFDHFLGNKFTTLKRYGGEGAESVMGFYEELFELASKNGISDVIMCIAHRGRNNLLTCLLNYPPVTMFRKIKGKSAFPPNVDGHDDVLAHLFSSTYLDYNGNKVHVSLLPNPSHLEAVNPVAVGKTRAKQQTRRAGDYAPDNTADARTGDKALCFQIHGDGAFSAQGIVPETFTLADVPHFSVGGSIHLVINNQLAFTNQAERGRSSQYSSDMAKINSCPVIHVNADYPEEIMKVCRLAMDYREKFRKDIVVDLVCYRKHGHNELDDPTFTQPIMYEVIKKRKSIPQL